jgi:hypothetical protein
MTIADGQTELVGSDLATAADLTTYGYASGATMLTRASVRVRRYLHQTVTAVDGDVVTIDAPYRLPQRPVRAVTTVLDVDGAAVTYTRRGAQLYIDASVGPVTVTYDHGFATLPAGLVEVVCGIAYRLEKQPGGLGLGVRTEGADGEQTTFGADAYEGVSGLTPGEEKALRECYPNLPQSVDLL